MAFTRGCLTVLFLSACLPVATQASVQERPRNCTFLQNGIASIYHEKFDGRRTASGEALDINAATAAHRTVGFGKWLRVTDNRTGRSTYVRVTDRGPFIKSRVIDVTRGASRALGWGRTGLHSVSLSICN